MAEKQKSESKNKTFDSVKLMRDIRDKMSADIAGMSFEEIKEYFKKRKAASISGSGKK